MVGAEDMNSTSSPKKGRSLCTVRIALPPNAILTVQLADVSLADAPASIIAVQKIDPAGQVPIAFELEFEAEVLRPKMSYAVQARITVDGRLWFINDERHSFDPAKPGPVKMMLKRVNQDATAEPLSLFGATWIAEDIAGRGVIDNLQSTFQIEPDGRISGKGGCNGYFAQAEIDGNSIRIGPIGSTFMACAPAIMDQEEKLHAALARVVSYRVGEEGKLFLVDADGVDILRFSTSG